MIIVTGSVVVKDEHWEQALALSLEHVPRSRAEAGCLAHAVHQDVEHPARLVCVEEWADQAALAAHFAVPAARAFAEVLGTLAVETPRLQVFEAQRTTG